jgi:TamB, inner membrane protein subunit of TAM complex
MLDAKIPSADVKVLKLPDKKLPSLDPNPDILLVHGDEKPHPPGKEPEEVEEEEKARAASKFRLRATLNIEHVYVSAEDFEFPVETQPELTFNYDPRAEEPATAHGTIHVPNGSFSALGRRFVIEDAKITETGGDLSDPVLDVKARYDNPNAVVTITISGRAKQPQLNLSSDPPMDQDAIAFFLATGRLQGQATQNGGGVDLQGAASSVLGSLLFGQVRNTLKSILPVDVLTVETQGAQLSQAIVGKYIGDRIYLGYRQRLTPAPAENTTEGRLEYEINRGLSAEATIGDKTKDLSVLWTHNF